MSLECINPLKFIYGTQIKIPGQEGQCGWIWGGMIMERRTTTYE